MKTPIYLDYMATTPVDARVFEAMKPYFLEQFGNAGSMHLFGDDAASAITKARQTIAHFIHAEKASSILFTSGATESNNLALQGVMLNSMRKHSKNHLITNAIEHPSVLRTVDFLESQGCEVTRIPLASDGSLNIDSIEKAIKPETAMISWMHVNNELGNINPIEPIGALAKQHGLCFHCDAAQSYGKIPIDVQQMNINLLSISGHKIYAPKGIGALYIDPALSITPMIYGGGQENGLRSGTASVPLIVALQEATHIASAEMQKNFDHAQKIRTRLLNGLLHVGGNVKVNGSADYILPTCLNISFLGIDANILVQRLYSELAASTSSACASYSPMPSHVLLALGYTPDEARSAVRFSFGKDTTEQEIDYVIATVGDAVKQIRMHSSTTAESS